MYIEVTGRAAVGDLQSPEVIWHDLSARQMGFRLNFDTTCETCESCESTGRRCWPTGAF